MATYRDHGCEEIHFLGQTAANYELVQERMRQLPLQEDIPHEIARWWGATEHKRRTGLQEIRRGVIYTPPFGDHLMVTNRPPSELYGELPTGPDMPKWMVVLVARRDEADQLEFHHTVMSGLSYGGRMFMAARHNLSELDAFSKCITKQAA